MFTLDVSSDEMFTLDVNSDDYNQILPMPSQSFLLQVYEIVILDLNSDEYK